MGWMDGWIFLYFTSVNECLRQLVCTHFKEVFHTLDGLCFFFLFLPEDMFYVPPFLFWLSVSAGNQQGACLQSLAGYGNSVVSIYHLCRRVLKRAPPDFLFFFLFS